MIEGGCLVRGNCLANLLQQSRHVCRQRRMPFHRFAADRMLQRQTRRVQGLTRETGQQGTQLRHAFLRAFEIHAVAYQGMADMGQMHAYLVGAAGLETAAQQRAALS